jgi:hypothetical protein
MEKKVGRGELSLFVCKNYISRSLISLNIFFAMFNFDKILIKSYISIWSLFRHVNNSKKTKQLLGFKKPRKKIRQNKIAWFSKKWLCMGWKPTKNQGSRKPSVLVGFMRQKKDCAYTLRGRETPETEGMPRTAHLEPLLFIVMWFFVRLITGKNLVMGIYVWRKKIGEMCSLVLG